MASLASTGISLYVRLHIVIRSLTSGLEQGLEYSKDFDESAAGVITRHAGGNFGAPRAVLYAACGTIQLEDG